MRRRASNRECTHHRDLDKLTNLVFFKVDVLQYRPSCSAETNTSGLAFVDCDSGVVFSGLRRASGEHITPNEFRNESSSLAPTLRIIIPSSPSPVSSTDSGAIAENEENACPELPSFTLTLASPISPRSPILPPSPTTTPFSPTSYYALAARTPPSARVPYLPQHCTHTLRPFAPLSSCKLCAVQLLACETWWNSRSHGAATLCAPQVYPATCTPTTRSIFYALHMPLGELDESCIDLDVVESIRFISRPAAQRKVNKKRVVRASSSRIRSIFRRMGHILTAPTRVPMVPTRNVAYRRAIVRR